MDQIFHQIASEAFGYFLSLAWALLGAAGPFLCLALFAGEFSIARFKRVLIGLAFLASAKVLADFWDPFLNDQSFPDEKTLEGMAAVFCLIGAAMGAIAWYWRNYTLVPLSLAGIVLALTWEKILSFLRQFASSGAQSVP